MHVKQPGLFDEPIPAHCSSSSSPAPVASPPPNRGPSLDEMYAKLKFDPLPPEAMDEESIWIGGHWISPREFVERYEAIRSGRL